VPVGDPDFDTGRFAALFQNFLERYQEALPRPAHELRDRVARHLGADPATLSTTRDRFDLSDLPNLQLAMNELVDASPDSDVIGLPAEVTHYSAFSLSSLLGGRFHGPATPTPVEYVNVPIDADRTLPCARLALYLLTVDATPAVVLVCLGERHSPEAGLHVEVIAPDQESADRLLHVVRELVDRHNVYRGKLLSFSFSEYGDYGLTFHRVPPIGRDDLVLPADDLEAIEQHTVAIADRATELLRAQRHLKRGLLLYGPPGTGKTYSVMYLCGRMPGRTTVLLTGPAAGALGQAVAIARALQPSMVVLEDVDLIAMERGMPGMGTNPLLYQLLNEMDGLAEDADIIFVLTTNRVDLLEPALAARPGRIDQAVEIKLPDAACRSRLLDLYLRGIDTDGADLSNIVDRTEGVSAAFIKELVRRASLRAVLTAAPADGRLSLTSQQLDEALTDLLEHSAPVLKSILGAAPPPPFDDDPGFTAAPDAWLEEEGWSTHPGPASGEDVE
jgi:cell division protease FtsH